MSAPQPNWNQLTPEQREKLCKAAEAYCEPGGPEPEEIASEMFYAVQESTAQTHSVQCYWNGDDREYGHSDPSEILDDIESGAVVEIEHVAVVDVTYEARLPAAEDAEYDDDFKVCENTREAAEAAITAEQSRRAAIEVQSA
ncbi:hypothetical protein [Pseudophaeobacter sp.]|uniref:hypothetical protein n=1 Tax=Pseudophaeobacter sp. TaxID=1971739 RepID=UPI0032D96216